MKESIPPLLVALAVLSACAKVETAPSSPDGIAISFSPVLGSVKTKANATPGQDFKFYSYAWYLPDGRTWDSNKADAEPYIVNETVSNQDGKWKSPTNTYYWPRGGSLTFLSYSCLSGMTFYPDAFTGGDTKTTVDKDGLKIEKFLLAGNDFDLLVADIAKDRRSDLNGVPTLLRHKLARVSLHVSTEESQTQDKYVLTGLKLTNIYNQGDYSGGGYDNDTWSNRSETSDYAILSGNTLNVSTDFQQVGSYVMVIPQNLLATAQGGKDSERQAPKIHISYTRNGEDQTPIDRELSGLGTNIWDRGKDYRYYIRFGSGDKPIDFSGSIGDWNDSNKSDINIGLQ